MPHISSPDKRYILESMSGGIGLIDCDNDGKLDIIAVNGSTVERYRNSGGGLLVTLYHQDSNLKFRDITAQAGLNRKGWGMGIAVADYDNDGLPDIYVTGYNGNALYHNLGNCKFADVTEKAGVGGGGFSTGAAWADYDRDGNVDLFVSRYVHVEMDKLPALGSDAKFCRYRGLLVQCGPWGMQGESDFLFHNRGNGTFEEVSKKAGVDDPNRYYGLGAVWADYDNDGWPDLFATSYFMSTDETARTYLGLPHNATTLRLYRNLGNGTFRDVTADVGLNKVFMPMGSNFGDLDNDGFLDIYLGMGTPSYASVAPHVLLRNKAGRSFVDVTASSGTGELHKGHGIAFVDLDNDGDEDIVAEIGGATPADSHAMRLFENPGHGNDWISLKLAGVKSNRAAIGARIKVTVADAAGGTRTIYRTVASGGSFGASPLEQHIGLGKAARIEDIEIWWPTSNTRQHFSSVEKNRAIDITELSPEYELIARERVRLGGAKRIP